LKGEENRRKLRWADRLGLASEKLFWDDICDFGKKHDPFPRST
jgi:hypothetical protein